MLSTNGLDYLISLKPVQEEPLRFIDELLQLSSGSKHDDLKQLIAKHHTTGAPLIDPALFRSASLENSMNLFIKLVKHVSAKNKELSLVYKDSLIQWQEEKATLKSFFIDILLGDPKNRCIARNEIMVFLIKLALRPSFEALYNQVQPTGASDKTSENNHCPLCGFPPMLAKIPKNETGGGNNDSNNNMTAVCSFCGYNWSCREDLCTCCGSSNMERAVTDREARINGCKDCKQYLRIIDQNMFSHSINDWFLDIISDNAHPFAMDKGYKQ